MIDPIQIMSTVVFHVMKFMCLAIAASTVSQLAKLESGPPASQCMTLHDHHFHLISDTIKSLPTMQKVLPFSCQMLLQGTSAGSMLALYIASKGGATLDTAQDWLPQDPWVQQPLHEGSVAVGWRIIRARAHLIFTPPWKQWLRYDQNTSNLC